MRTRLMWALSALVMTTMMFATSCSKDDEGAEPEKEETKFEFAKGICIAEYDSGDAFEDGDVCLMYFDTETNFYISNSKGVMLGGDGNQKTKWSVSGPDLTITSDNVGADVSVHFKNKRFGDEDRENILCAEDEMGNKHTIKIAQKSGFVFDMDAAILISGAPQHIGSFTFTSGPYEAMLYIGRKSDGAQYDSPKTKWSTSDSSVVSLDTAVGTKIGITARKNGTATITATDDAGHKLTFVITVQNK